MMAQRLTYKVIVTHPPDEYRTEQSILFDTEQEAWEFAEAFGLTTIWQWMRSEKRWQELKKP